MSDQRLHIIEELVSEIPTLTAGQLYWLERVVRVFMSAHYYTIAKSDLFDTQTLENYGDAMRVHHSFSIEPFSKDKFEDFAQDSAVALRVNRDTKGNFGSSKRWRA